jgi:choline dehydrogenase
MAYDYIIVGAGTAGCLLANRLSQDPAVSVLLLEAGPRPRGLWVRMPAGVSKLIFPGPMNWGFSTEPEPHLNGRQIYAPRGRGLGGSSLINGMAFFRGQPRGLRQLVAVRRGRLALARRAALLPQARAAGAG